MDIDFISQYININFDNMLLNKLVHSEEFYLQYKKKYFDETNNNYQKYKVLVCELNELTNGQYINSGTKYKYVYVDTAKIESLKKEIKKILIHQNQLLDHFNNHIILLNTNPDKFESVSTKTSNKKSFLSKLFQQKSVH